jgi:hypothetical protein
VAELALEHLRQNEVPLRGRATGNLDFNGYYGRGMAIIVPTGWSVKVDFSNGPNTAPARPDADQALFKVGDAGDADGTGRRVRCHTKPLEGIGPKESVNSTSSPESLGAIVWPCALLKGNPHKINVAFRRYCIACQRSSGT